VAINRGRVQKAMAMDRGIQMKRRTARRVARLDNGGQGNSEEYAADTGFSLSAGSGEKSSGKTAHTADISAGRGTANTGTMPESQPEMTMLVRMLNNISAKLDALTAVPKPGNGAGSGQEKQVSPPAGAPSLAPDKMSNGSGDQPDNKNTQEKGSAPKSQTDPLSPSQDELAKELEQTLGKLQQAIRESEAVADKIRAFLEKPQNN